MLREMIFGFWLMWLGLLVVPMVVVALAGLVARCFVSRVSLAGQRVLVTGVSADNLNAALATCAVEECGASSVVLLHWRATGVDELRERLVATGCACVTHNVDLTDDASVRRVLAQVGRVDIAILGHVMCTHYQPAAAIGVDVVRQHMEVNVLSVVRLVQLLCGPQSVYGAKRHPRIMVLSSAAALVPQPFRAAYCASKAALSAWVAVWALENATTSVQVVHPGMVDTPPVRSEYDANVRRSWALDARDTARRLLATPASAFVVNYPWAVFWGHLLWVCAPRFCRAWLPAMLPRTNKEAFVK